MGGIFVTTLYVLVGVCGYAALHHGLAVIQRRARHIHILFAVLCVAIMALILAKAGAYQAQTVEELVTLRKWEISAVCFVFMFFPWFIAGYTGVGQRKLLVGLSLFWGMIFVVNLSLPYGVQYADAPHLSYFRLPWGEGVVDLRVLQPSVWHMVGWVGVLVIMAFGVYACIAHYRRGQQKRARAMAWALGLFFASILFNLAVNRGIVEFVHLSDFGFLSLLVMMDLEMTRESRDQKRRMRDVLDHLPAAICLKDLHGRMQLINRGYETCFQVSAADLLGKTDFDLFPREQAERFRADELLAVETGQAVEHEYALEWNGGQRIYQSHLFPLLRPDGTPYATCAVYVDNTESRAKDEALHKLRRQIWHIDRVASTGALTASLAHELAQPLAAILNNAQAGQRFLSQDNCDLDEIREIFQDIVRDDKRAAAVINGLRAMLQQQELPHADVDLAQCMEEAMTLLHSEFVRQGVVIERLWEPNVTARLNKPQIQQVLLNLMINAMESMADQPMGKRIVRVTATRADGKALVSIRDSGKGIPPEMLERVFDGFYTTKAQGLGVGLAVCRSIMESHGGAIWAEANPEGGATFHFTLPLSREPAASDAIGSRLPA